MTLTENYLLNNGYDYFDNAAEDTLLFFVRDEDAPFAQPKESDEHDEVGNTFDNSLQGTTGTMPVPDDNSNDDDIAGTVPQMAPVDEKQTDAQRSRLKN